MKKRLLPTLLLVLSVFSTQAQDRLVIFFKDKNNSTFSLSNPSQFLSQRAIDRRLRQNIAIDSSDLPVNTGYVQALANAGANVLNVSKWFNAAIVEIGSASVLNAIMALPFVQSSVDVGRPGPGGHVDKFQIESPLQRSKSPSIAKNNNLSYGYAAGQIQQLNLAPLHLSGHRGQGICIAVLDAGFLDLPQMSCFDSLRLSNRIDATWDFVDREPDVYDDHYHGSAVLSCMASHVPDSLIGTAPGANYILLRSEDAGTEYIIEEYNWCIAAEFADSAGADIINSSLGYTTFDDPSQDHTYSDMDGDTNPSTIAADWAAAKGIVVVNSAGNSGNSNWNYIGAPADADSILSIGAVDNNGFYASFSSNGPSFDGRVKPDVAACGSGTWLYSPYSNNQPVQGNGTSFSSPLLAGAVACLWQAQPLVNGQDLIEAVRASAHQNLNPDTLLGHGIPDFSFAGQLLGVQFPANPENAQLLVYPNPSVGTSIRFVIQPQSGQTVEWRIFDICGRQIQSGSARTQPGQLFSQEVDELPTDGLYSLVVTDGDRRYVARLVVN